MRKTIIEPNGRNLQYWKDVLNYRELAYNLAKRDITVRYKQTRVGLGWAVISPLINMLVMTFIFGNLAGLESDGGAPYHVMVYAGSIPWGIFSKALSSGANTFIANANIMKKVYYPRILSPIGAGAAALFDSGVSMLIMIVILMFSRYFSGAKFFLFPVFLLLSQLIGLSLGLFLASFNVKWRDLAQVIPFMVSIGQYLTPVAYSIDSITNKTLRFVYSLNPATGVVNAFKWCLLKDMSFDWLSFVIALIWLAILLPLGIHLFRKTERTFVDIV